MMMMMMRIVILMYNQLKLFNVISGITHLFRAPKTGGTAIAPLVSPVQHLFLEAATSTLGAEGGAATQYTSMLLHVLVICNCQHLFCNALPSRRSVFC